MSSLQRNPSVGLTVDPAISTPRVSNATSPTIRSATQVVRGIMSCVAQATSDLDLIKSPQAEYEADVAELQASLQELWTRAYATTDLRERAGIQNAVGVCHVDLHLLESRYKSNLEIETRKYEERTEAVIQELCDQLVAELGPSHIRGTLRALDPEELSCYVPKVTSDKIITRNGNHSATPHSPGTVHDKKNGAIITRSQLHPGIKRCGAPGSDRPAKIRATEENRKQLSRRRRRTRKNNDNDNSDQNKPTAQDEPTPGQVYLVWELSKAWSAVLLLSTNTLYDVGVPATFEGLDLSTTLPDCYVLDTNSKTCTWRRGYEDGGPLVTERLYPVTYLEGRSLLNRRVGWLAARDLKAYDEEIASSLYHFPQIQEYLHRRRGLEGRVDDSDKTIVVSGDTSQVPALNVVNPAASSSSSGVLPTNCTQSSSASEPCLATTDITVLRGDEAALLNHNRIEHSDQTRVRSCSRPQLEGLREGCQLRQAAEQSQREGACFGRSSSIDLGTGETFDSASTDGQEHVEAQQKAIPGPLVGLVPEPDLAAQPACGGPHETVSTADNGKMRLGCSQVDDSPLTATVGEPVPSAVLPVQSARNGSHEGISDPTCPPLLSIHSPELGANRPLNEPSIAAGTNSVSGSNEFHSPSAQPLDSQSRQISSLLGPIQSILPRASITGFSPPEMAQSRPPAGLSSPQSVSSHILHTIPSVTEALRHKGTAMHEPLPPVQSPAENMLHRPTRLSTGELYVRETPECAGPDEPAVEPHASGPLNAQYRWQQNPATELSLNAQLTAPRIVQSSKNRRCGAWPAEFPQLLVIQLQGVFRRRNGLSDDFNVLPDHFMRADNRYHCPFCSEGKWKTPTDFISHLKGCHGRSI